MDGLASPCTGQWLIAICWGTRLAHGVPPGLVASMPIRRRKLPGKSLSAGGLVLFWYLFMKYCSVNGTLPGGAYPLARSRCDWAWFPDEAALGDGGIDSHPGAWFQGRVGS
jgi:hypothetical protein